MTRESMYGKNEEIPKRGHGQNVSRWTRRKIAGMRGLMMGRPSRSEFGEPAGAFTP
jgi:hypothetical protein